MSDPTHLRKENLIYAQEMADAVQVLIRRSQYLLKVGETHQDTIEWDMYERELFQRTKKFLDLDEEQ